MHDKVDTRESGPASHITSENNSNPSSSPHECQDSISLLVYALLDFIMRSMYHMFWLATLLVGSDFKGLSQPKHINFLVSCAGQ